MKKITETQRLSTAAVRALCVAGNLYTQGTIEEYNGLFAKVRALRGPIITAEDLYTIAADIVAHSGPGVEVEAIMWELGRRIERHFEVKEYGQYVVTCECTDSGPEFMIYTDGRTHRAFEVVMATFNSYAEAVAYKRAAMGC